MSFQLRPPINFERPTDKEIEALKAFVETGSLKEAADRLKISKGTLDERLVRLRLKLRIGPMIWLVIWATKNVKDIKWPV